MWHQSQMRKLHVNVRKKETNFCEVLSDFEEENDEEYCETDDSDETIVIEKDSDNKHCAVTKEYLHDDNVR